MPRPALLSVVAAALAVVLSAAACGGGSGGQQVGTLTLAVDAPFTGTPYVGDTILNGAQLAADQVNVSGLAANGKTYRLRIKRYDNGLSPRRAVADIRSAIDDDAVAVLTDGTGVDAGWSVANAANLPLGIVYQGGIGLVDPEKRPNVFRIAPTDRGVAFRLAEYLIPKGLRIALLVDDSNYGEQGSRALASSFGHNPEAVATRLTVPSRAGDLAPQVLRARRAGATALLVWGGPSTIARVLTAARSSGWDVPVYTPPTGEDPLVRQELSDHPDWVDGLTFASGRMTAEIGTAPFVEFEKAYEAAHGPQLVGVRTPAGARVVQPPDYAMYAYDFVNLLVAAIDQAGKTDGRAILAALKQVTVRGANGDERGFNQRNHDGVVDDDVYFARFHGMTFSPVRDDPLSATLPVIDQTR